MLPVPLTIADSIPRSTFWEIVMLFHNRPFLINRLVTATSPALFHKVLFKSSSVEHVSELFTTSAILSEMRQMKIFSKTAISEEFITNILQCYDKNMVLTPSNEASFIDEPDGVFISVRILLSKINIAHKCLEVVVLDKDKNSAVFISVAEPGESRIAPPFPYELELNSSSFRMNLSNFEDADSTHADWLADKLFPKLLKWSKSNFVPTNKVNPLSLISIDEYCFLYSELKKKYSENLLKDWLTKTKTNPQKYIFEDLAIASYLICLWKLYPEKSVKFIDLGCGNGLLVHVLNQEGYEGYGIDIRRRALWDIYPPDTKLQVGTVLPSSLFPDCTWLIGNHSDELTPWIPVIALRSSPITNFFLLPCCPFDFSGQKYTRTNTSLSTYSEYLLYIEQICQKCSFETRLDNLRIPSTRKNCLIGLAKDLNFETLSKIHCEVDKFIDSRMSTVFKLRSSVEPVRNCTQLDRQFIAEFVKTCVNILLVEGTYLLKPNGDDWNKGSALSISCLSKKISADDLQKLKNQCGGLQTLFRNHRYIFVVEKGNVQLRMPATLETDGLKYKKKICWFYKNHPDGCFNSDDTCGFDHSMS
ncbi:probable tRNA (uracil-O(2)-)-methyltransferase isoform X1 [Leptinotarsa decemlineata]|uniref:probable tRNA (uracil-O(2)-)-methyltransferase isoform X1 n=2 Tax=Leptinotarsa decemlineata TaxID=7539 RepID=UPI003D30C2E5